MNDMYTNDDVSISSTNTIISTTSIKRMLIDDMSYDDIIEVENEIYKCMDEYLKMDILQISNPLYHEKLYIDVFETIYVTINSIYELEEYEEAFNEISAFVKERINIYCETMISPQRSCITRDEYQRIYNVTNLEKQIERLRNSYQPAQRTTAWYEYRYNLLTASNISKIIGSDAKKNSLIYEKCQPLLLNETKMNVNVNSPIHWGNKYEPVSLNLYEHIYNTNVEDFGCIRHTNIECLGASPDGINTNIKSPLYGRMIEIKNIVNREITGIPLEAYWIQMQIQMEVCNLDECDFFETQFKEFHTVDEFNESDKEYTGVILYFISNNDGGGNPHYVYMPMSLCKDNDSVAYWIQENVLTLKETHSLYKTLYWYLEMMSCVLVQRNIKWFSALHPHIISTWGIIENERLTGYEHRKPKQKTRKCNIILIKNVNVCN